MQDNPDGKLKKEKMMEMYGAVLPPEKAKVFVDQIFLKFDSDKSDTIDFKVKVETFIISDLYGQRHICFRSSCWQQICQRQETPRKS